MTIPEIDILVLRKGTWSTVKSSELVPGDLCCLRRTEDEVLIPCDMLLISGSCISNEAMLTGESTPQIKEPISFRAADEVLNPNQDKLHILFAGTKIVKHSTEENKQAPKGS
jgi:cation-transporting ATPase 13A1